MKKKNAAADLSTNFLSFLGQGSLKITRDDNPILNFTVANNTMVIDIIDIPIQVSGKPGMIKQLSEAKSFAKKLKQENTTLEIRLHGEPVLKLGKDANPRLAKIVTLSSAIEISSLKKLKRLNDVF